MSITLTVTESDNQFVSGIPEYVTLSTSSPATIFYTINGDAPSPDESDIYVDYIFMPTDKSYVKLSMLVLPSNGSAEEFEHEFYTSQENIDGRRLMGSEGISVLRVGSEVVDSISLDLDGYASQETSIELSELDIKTSQYDSSGYENPDKTSHDFIKFSKKNSLYNDGDIFGSTSVNSNIFFNPKAGYIDIDGTTKGAIESQEVRIVNRANGTMSTVGNAFNDHLLQAPPVTGNLVRSYYDKNKNIMISYYYESRECRWIVSKQSVDLKTIVASSPNDPRSRFVFKWVKSRHMSKIY